MSILYSTKVSIHISKQCIFLHLSGKISFVLIDCPAMDKSTYVYELFNPFNPRLGGFSPLFD